MEKSLLIAVSSELLKHFDIDTTFQQLSQRVGVACSYVVITVQDDVDQFREKIQDCDVAFILPWYFAKVGECLPLSLKWIHCAWAGVEPLNSLDAETRKRMQQSTITRSAGAYCVVMAEYVICAIISMERNMPLIIKRSMNQDWQRTKDVYMYRNLSKVTVGILGLGSIGKEVAKICSSMGMTVYGMNTSSDPVENVEKVYKSNQLTQLLEACDYICNILPSTTKTKGLLSDGVLKVCSNKPICFINIGRGDIIDEKSIVEAVNNGWIEKAFLDVFEKEPLPADSPLWSLKNVTITPHVSGTAGADLIVEEFAENLENFVQGKQLKHVFSWDNEY